MSVKFNRFCTLTFTQDGGDEVLDLSEFQVYFEVHQAFVGTPNWATIRVYSLSRELQQLILKEFAYADLAVGYGSKDDVSRLFYGQVRQVNGGLRDNSVDSFTDFICQDGDYGYNWSTVSKTLRAGHGYNDMLEVLGDSFKEKSLSVGYIGALPTVKFPRGRVMYGASRDHMTRVADNVNSEWTIRDGVIKMVPYESYEPGQAVVVASSTGMIGLPKQTLDGISFRMLIDPKVRDGSLVELENDVIQAQDIPVNQGAALDIPGYDPNGIYKVYSIDHTGDTRGKQWFSDVICVGLNANKPRTSTYTNATRNNGQ